MTTIPACQEDNCTKPVKARGLCSAHYTKMRRNAGTDAISRRFEWQEGECRVDGCTDDKHSRGYCLRHYQRWLRVGKDDALVAALRKNKPFGSGTLTQGGYRVIVDHSHPNYANGRVPEHRAVMEEYLGRYLLPHETVHHRNGDRADNRLSNLELWSTWQPYGQRVEDKLAWAEQIIEQYRTEVPKLKKLRRKRKLTRKEQ